MTTQNRLKIESQFALQQGFLNWHSLYLVGKDCLKVAQHLSLKNDAHKFAC
jgi:hypothetical protein